MADEPTGAADLSLEPQISLVSRAEKPSQRDQLEEVIRRARDRQEPIRLRLPLHFYDTEQGRGYTAVRDAAWNITLPSETTSPEAVERFIYTISRCLAALSELGTEQTLRKLGVEP